MLGFLLFGYAMIITCVKGLYTDFYTKKITSVEEDILPDMDLLEKSELLSKKLDYLIKKQGGFGVIIILSLMFGRYIFSGYSILVFGVGIGWVWWYILYLIFGAILWGFLKV